MTTHPNPAPKLNLTGHFMAGGWPHDWLALGPRVMKFHASLPPRPMPREFEGLILIGRPAVYRGFSPEVWLRPDIAARDYFHSSISPMLEEAPWLTHVETPNEPEWDYAWSAMDKRTAMEWYAAYFFEFAKIAKDHGRKAVLGNWSVGNPDLPSWQWYGRALEAVQKFGAVLGRHSYGWLNDDLAYRHRLDEREFGKLGFTHTPLVITECGAENDKGMKSWRGQYGNDMRAYYEQWLRPFEFTLRQDAYVLGATIYTVGTGGSNAWLGHDVSNTPIVQYLGELAREPWPTTPPPPLPPGEKKLTNQDVINIVSAVAKRPVGMTIPYDVLAAMLSQRPAPYTGPDPMTWGLTGSERVEILRRMK